MLTHIRSNLVAYVALFVALGGTSVAATKALLPANSVGTRQVIDRSLLRQDFKPGQLPRGARGPRGSSATLKGVHAGGDLTGIYPNPRIRPGISGWVLAPGSLNNGAIATRDWLRVTTYAFSGFLNGWHDAGGGWPAPAYYEDFLGDFHFRGSIAGGTVSRSAGGDALWFCGPLLEGPRAFSVPTQTASGAFVPGEVVVAEVLPGTPGPLGGVGCPAPACGAPDLRGGGSVPREWCFLGRPETIRVTAGASGRVSLDAVYLASDLTGQP